MRMEYTIGFPIVRVILLALTGRAQERKARRALNAGAE